MPEQKSQAWHYCNVYRQTLREWEPKIGERAAHDLAQRRADGAKFILTSGEYRACNKWLDSQYPVRTKKVEEVKPPGLFDEVMRAE